MSERDSSGRVPTWDGQARGWRRYTKEVAWFVASTPVHKRRYVASRLISQLQGTARLLAMSWNRSEFDCNGGTLLLLRKLASSPLVRRTLPNTAAILQQYLSFKRRPGESMANFLVRETLGYEEFAEALQRLWEERNGIDQSEVNFGLPLEEDSWDAWWYGDGHDGESNMDSNAGEGERDAEHVQPGDGDLQGDASSATRGDVRASAGSSPSHGHGGAPPLGPPSVHAVSVQAPSVALHELSPTDSFIMGVLRGWRLLRLASTLKRQETSCRRLRTSWSLKQLARRFKPCGMNSFLVSVTLSLQRHLNMVISTGSLGKMINGPTMDGMLLMMMDGGKLSGMMNIKVMNGHGMMMHMVLMNLRLLLQLKKRMNS